MWLHGRHGLRYPKLSLQINPFWKLIEELELKNYDQLIILFSQFIVKMSEKGLSLHVVLFRTVQNYPTNDSYHLQQRKAANLHNWK